MAVKSKIVVLKIIHFPDKPELKKWQLLLVDKGTLLQTERWVKMIALKNNETKPIENLSMEKILYIYTSGRSNRFQDIYNGDAPDDMFYGFFYFKQRGYHVDMLEINTEASTYSSKGMFSINAFFRKSIKTPFNLHNRVLDIAARRKYIKSKTKLFEQYDLIICCVPYIGIELALIKNKCNLKPYIIYIGLGTSENLLRLPGKHPWAWELFKNRYTKIFKNCGKNVLLGKGQYDHLIEAFPNLKDHITFLPFGIDCNFWTPNTVTAPKEARILFIGNDVHRDFELLMKIAKHLMHLKFRFVSKRLSYVDVPPNVEIIRGDWCNSPLSDNAIKRIYHNSTLVILPLKNVLQPTGQSVSLQAMACGKPVLINKTEGFWDPDGFINMKHLVFVEPNTVDEWAKNITKVLNEKYFYETLSTEGQKLVRSNYSSIKFSENIENIFLNFKKNR